MIGRGAIRVVVSIASVLALLVPTVAAAPQPGASAGRPGDYTAARFDVAATVVPGGDLHVTETITFQFESGTFRRVWREIPTARTDGIEIERAAMDGQASSRGDGPGQVKISGRNRIRVEWQFDPVGPSTHTFELRYRARGVVFRDGADDVLKWRLLPSEHKYAIAESRSTIAAPVAAVGPPVTTSNRVGDVSTPDGNGGGEILARAIRTDGWVIAELHYPAGALISTQPDWQQRHEYAGGLAPRWGAAAAGLLGAALVLLVSVRSGYPRPGIDAAETTTTTDPPEALPAALASVLAAGGRTAGYQSVATIFDLADRGVLTVRELPRSFRVRSYELSQVPGKHDLDPHELDALSIAFGGRADNVSLSKARARLARGARRFAASVNQDLAARGYLDPARMAVRDRLMRTSVVLLVAGAISAPIAASLIPRFAGWPFLLPFALCAAGIVGVIMAATTSPLSDAGLLQASRWRGFKQHLKSAMKGDAPGAVRPRWLVYGIAVGLAPQWARYLKAHPAEAPRWFRAATQDDSGAFAAFIGSHAAASGSAGAGGGAAAGGGGSGAG